MKPITISRQDLKTPANWATNGQSPANSPQAQLQAAQMLLGASQDPRTGLDPYELVKIIANASLPNAKNIQISKEQLASQLSPAPTPPPPGLVGGQPQEGPPQPGSAPLPGGPGVSAPGGLGANPDPGPPQGAFAHPSGAGPNQPF